MGISNISRLLHIFRSSAPAPDLGFDALIREALCFDLAEGPSSGTWDRLRMSIMDRGRMHRNGMWLLDEPFRDPPEPVRLSEHQLARARSLHDVRTEDLRRQGRELVWSQLMPPFAVLLNV
jgi:hypothetical protein